MFQSFRHAMTWVHTWFGLLLGFVLVVVFFFGSLSVFDREIDRWAIPATRIDPQPMPSFDTVLRPVFEKIEPSKAALDRARSQVDGDLPARLDTVRRWGASSTHRDPTLRVFAAYAVPGAEGQDIVVTGRDTIDPRNGNPLLDGQLTVGSGFFYPLHYSLTLYWMDLGRWIVGFGAMMMMVALITGVVMHRKLFREFFTFRPMKNAQRSVLDLHNMTGVLALPFHFFFAFTGLVIFAGIYFPVTHTQLEPLHELHETLEEAKAELPQRRAGVAAPLASVDAMVVEARRRWAARGMAGEVGFLAVDHVGDANGTVSIYRAGTDRITNVSEGVHFKASTGEVLHEDPPQTAVESLRSFLFGLHLQHFRHWLLRWFYMLGGLMGVTCIATGLIFFAEKRKKQHARLGRQGSRVVDALAVTTITGMLIATLSILIANRLLPETLPAGWPSRYDLQIHLFWSGWALALLHAFVRGGAVARGEFNPAWREQCWAIAAMAVTAVLANWITTGDHLLSTVVRGYWPVAGVDLFLLASAALAVFGASKLRRRETDGMPDGGARHIAPEPAHV